MTIRETHEDDENGRRSERNEVEIHEIVVERLPE